MLDTQWEKDFHFLINNNMSLLSKFLPKEKMKQEEQFLQEIQKHGEVSTKQLTDMWFRSYSTLRYKLTQKWHRITSRIVNDVDDRTGRIKSSIAYYTYEWFEQPKPKNRLKAVIPNHVLVPYGTTLNHHIYECLMRYCDTNDIVPPSIHLLVSDIHWPEIARLILNK